jgi:hypothetical protein
VCTRQQQAVDLLRSAGWQVAVVRPDQSVAEVWSLLGGPDTGPSGAATYGTPSVSSAGQVPA